MAKQEIVNFFKILADIYSDVFLGLDFIGVIGSDHHGTSNSTNGTLIYHDPMTFSNSFSNLNADNRGRPDEVKWGIGTFVIVGAPGFMLGYFLATEKIKDLDWWKIILLLIPCLIFAALSGIFFPIYFPVFYLYYFCQVYYQGKKKDETIYGRVDRMKGLEVFCESAPQMILQFYIALRRGPESSDWFQITSLFISFIMVIWSSCDYDIEMKKYSQEKKFTTSEKFSIALERAPYYLMGSIFRCLSLSLTIAFLYNYALIPIGILTIVNFIVCLKRFKKIHDKWITFKSIESTLLLSIANMTSGSMHAHRIIDIKNDKKKKHEEKEEDDRDVTFFFKSLAIYTTVHHIVVLIIIMALGSALPTCFDHWQSPEFWLKAGSNDFYWALGITMFFGVYNGIEAIRLRIDSNISNKSKFKAKAQEVLKQQSVLSQM